MLPFLMFSSPRLFPSVASPVAPHRKTLRPIISSATSLESTLPMCLASVHSKTLAATRFPLESTLTKKTRGRGQLLLTSKTREARATESGRSPATIKSLPWPQATLNSAANSRRAIFLCTTCWRSAAFSRTTSRSKRKRSRSKSMKSDLLTPHWRLSSAPRSATKQSPTT